MASTLKIDSQVDSEKAKQDLLSKIGDISGFSLTGNQVIVGIYVRDKIGSIIMSDTSKKEDEYQGKVGLILKTGEKAFDREWQKLYGDSVIPKVGDWVTYKVYDGWQQKVNGYACRQLDDSNIRAVVWHPDMVY